MFIYSVQDIQIPSFGDNALMLAHSDGQMLRIAYDMFMGGPNPVVQHPEDYILYCVGEFDAATGVVTGSPPRPVKSMRELLGKTLAGGLNAGS